MNLKFLVLQSFVGSAILILFGSCTNKESVPKEIRERITGTWEWVSSQGGVDGATLTPATEGYTQRIELDGKETYKFYQNGVLKTTKEYKLGDNKVKGDGHPWTIELGDSELYYFRVYDTLYLRENCIDCFEHLYVRSKENDPNKPIIESDSLYDSGLDVYSTYLPSIFRAYVIDNMAGWTIPKQNSWDQYWWDQYKKEKSLVNYLPGDFNCDNKTDYSMILTDPRGSTAAWVFLAKDNDFEKTMLELVPKEEGPIGIGLELMPKGKHGDLSTNKTVAVKCEGITIIFFEKAAHSYYWDQGGFKMLQTGD